MQLSESWEDFHAETEVRPIKLLTEWSSKWRAYKLTVGARTPKLGVTSKSAVEAEIGVNLR